MTHRPLCNCFDCSTNNVDGVIGLTPLRNSPLSNNPLGYSPSDNYADAMNPNKVLGGTLLSRTHNVNIYTSPTGKLIKTVAANSDIGNIYSWIDKDGVIWWELESKPDYGGGGFVKHIPGVFDIDVLQNSLSNRKEQTDQEIKAKVAKRLEETKKNNALYAFGSDPSGYVSEKVVSFLGKFKWLLIAVLLLVIIAVFLRVKG